MTGSLVALDTNYAIALLAGETGAIAAIQGFDEMCLPVPVLGELKYGAMNSERSAANLNAVESLVGRCRILSVDAQSAQLYADVRLALKRIGRPIPENDVWIAALCLQHSAVLATVDAHFGFVAGVRLVRPGEPI